MLSTMGRLDWSSRPDMVMGRLAVIRFALLCLALACSSRRSATSPGSIAAPIAAPPAAIAVPPIDAASCTAGSNIPNGACRTDSDCVLTDLADACDACNLARVYPTRKVTFDARVARCATTPPCTAGCPRHDDYTGGFYRPECRRHHCIAWRYHTGG
jgi:hypothetical protein